MVADVLPPQQPTLQESPDPRKYASYLATRPASFEEDAAALLLDVLLQEHIPPTRGFFLHIAHLGDAKNVEGFRVSGGSSSRRGSSRGVRMAGLCACEVQLRSGRRLEGRRVRSLLQRLRLYRSISSMHDAHT